MYYFEQAEDMPSLKREFPRYRGLAFSGWPILPCEREIPNVLTRYELLVPEYLEDEKISHRKWYCLKRACVSVAPERTLMFEGRYFVYLDGREDFIRIKQKMLDCIDHTRSSYA